MKKFLLLLFLPLLLAGSFVAINEACLSEAQAARLGGGRSFGGKSAFQRRAPAQTPARQPGTQTQSAAAQSGAAQSVPRGGMGGFLGPLLAGSMLGALIFGGAFQGLGAMDLVVILLGVFLLTRLLRGRRAARQTAGPGGLGALTRQDEQDERTGAGGQALRSSDNATSGSGNGQPFKDPLRGRGLRGHDSPEEFWESLRDKPDKREEQRAPDRYQRAPQRASNEKGAQTDKPRAWERPARSAARPWPASGAGEALRMPEGFDPDDFMAGARAMYLRLQEAWDSRDLEDIDQFTTPAAYAEIRRQALEDPEPSQTDILLINAKLIEVEEERAAVYFDVLLREEAGRPNIEAREIWHFTRRGSETWKLDGIQQTE